jgi:hypothetical protein
VSAGYGVEAWCTDEYFSGRYARGWMVVAQAIYRRLITPRGMLRGGDEERNGGLDLSEYVGAVGTATALAALPNLVRGEIQKDDRVSPGGVTVRATVATEGNGDVTILLDISVRLADESEDFTLTVGVDETSTELLDVSAPP